MLVIRVDGIYEIDRDGQERDARSALVAVRHTDRSNDQRTRPPR